MKLILIKKKQFKTTNSIKDLIKRISIIKKLQ